MLQQTLELSKEFIWLPHLYVIRPLICLSFEQFLPQLLLKFLLKKTQGLDFFKLLCTAPKK